MTALSNRPIVIGAGLAGLTTALSLAPMPVLVLSAGPLGEQCSSAWAQGGVAAAMGADDHASVHAEDTIRAGAGLCDRAIVRLVTEGGAKAIGTLLGHGVPFDRTAGGHLQLGLEGAHSRRRIVHAGGDGAGRAIMQAIVAAVRATPSITVLENAIATRLLTTNDGVGGVAFRHNARAEEMATDRVILATGGAGALWRHTTNPLGSWGHGLALAARAGAELIDLEFMQFHPTAIDIGRDPMPLASEALRGEGASLIDEIGERFMVGFERGELEPRDIVARAIWQHMAKGHSVFLDARHCLGSHFAKEFPAINEVCLSAGIDPATKPIPVRPAAHYHMGGITVNATGRSSMNGVWACGEVAATGLHGANRLASNSLLEAAFFGERVAEDVKNFASAPIHLENTDRRTSDDANKNDSPNVREVMSSCVGVLRDAVGLEKAIDALAPLAAHDDRALVALMITTAAYRREESRGGHARTDYPSMSEGGTNRYPLTLKDVAHAESRSKIRVRA